MRTFLELQDAVLTKTGDETDQDKMRDLVKLSINTVQKQILSERRYQFMLWPRTETLSVTSGRKSYPLHPQMSELWYGQNSTTHDFLEEIPAGGVVEMGDNMVTGESSNPYRFILTAIQNVKMQPQSDGVLVVTTTGGTESLSNKIIVKGINSSGEYTEETLSTGSAWSTLTSSTVWNTIESITKYGSTWTRIITCTVGSDVILTLNASEFGRQYRQLELTKTPTASVDFLYRFYRRPLSLVNDNDIPQIPADFDDILVYGSLVDLQGYIRSEPNEFKENVDYRDKLITQMQQKYQQSRSVYGRNSYITHFPR